MNSGQMTGAQANILLEHEVVHGAFPYLICVCESQAQIAKKRVTRSRLPPSIKKTVANRKYLRFSVYVESRILRIANICDLLLVVTSSDPKDRDALFILPFFHRLLSGSYRLLLKGLECKN
jgi:hypothetical protein